MCREAALLGREKTLPGPAISLEAGEARRPAFQISPSPCFLPIPFLLQEEPSLALLTFLLAGTKLGFAYVAEKF